MKPTVNKPRISAKDLRALSLLADETKRASFLRNHPSLFHADAHAELNAAALKELQKNTNTALALAEAAVTVAGKLRKKDLLGQSLRVKANVLSAAGKHRLALTFYDRALQAFSKINDHEGTARTLAASIQPKILLGEYDAAFQSADQARALFETLGDVRRLARLENNIGNIYHRQDRFEEAIAHYEKAYEQLLEYGDSEELTISLNNMAMCLISMNDFARALSTYARAKELLQTRDLPLLRLITDYNIAYLYYLRGDYHRAIDMLRETREASQKIDYEYLIALCYLDLSDIYVELNLSSEVQEVAYEGYVYFAKLGIGYEAAKTIANQAIALGQEGKMRQALELFDKARTLFVKEKNLVWPWLIDLYQGLVLYHEGRYFESRRLCKQAAKFFDQSILQNKAVLCHFVLAQLAMRTGNLEDARAECEFAIAVLEKVEAPILHYQGHFLMGQIEQALGNPAEAYAAYQEARTELENLRSSLDRDELKISFMKNKTEIYEHLVELCLSRDNKPSTTEEAWQYIELAKSRSLTELLFQRNHSLPGNELGQSELAHRIRDLREELNWYQQRIELEQLRPEGNSAERIERLQSEAREREKSLLRQLRDLPDSNQGIFSSKSDVSIATIRESLPANATLLEYFFAGEQVIAVVITKTNLEIVPLTLTTQISELMRLLRFQLSKLRTSSRMAEAFKESLQQTTDAHLKELYDELFAPLRAKIAGDHIVFVPHGMLHHLPFHALFDGRDYLIDAFTVSYAPSASVYAFCQSAPPIAAGESLIFGVPDNLAPYIEEEVQAVARILPSPQLFLGERANHETLRQKAQTSRLIHIATHGSFRQDNPMFSGIKLGDSYLHLYELYQLRLAADLLTLSGCATGLNVVTAGDEVLGLIRGALYAGAQSLLLTLWDVHDRSAAQFMTSFYGRLNSTQNKALSLSGAMKELRSSQPHPYYWAPFVLVGKALSSV
ncbi:MAG TPA: CHAT domain-containing protein [Candidatus Saccharimonadales bacterium]|nr:CHAT domain-containing protein [Candidatus Saccharimonadales bacterium]